MALQNERDDGKQTSWFARLARERQDLSASVEDALHSEKEHPWQEDEGTEGKVLIPPRLTLQSRPLPAVGQDEKLGGATRKLPVPETFKLPAIQRQQEKEAGGFLARFARRLTSSLSAFGHGTDTFPVLPPPSSEEDRLLSRQRDEVSLLPPDLPEKSVREDALPANANEPPATPQPVAAPKPRTVPPRPVMAPVTAVLPTMPSRPGRYRQRLAGRATRVRLQTAPVPAVPRPVTPRVSALEAVARAQSIEEAKREERAVSSLPTVALPQDEPNLSASSSLEVASKEVQDGQSALHSVMGSGTCDVGQHDIMVYNQAVTASSVVLVTLTSKPGPVVVQYVSLQAGIGFTIHLTAPAEAQAAFNYAILNN